MDTNNNLYPIAFSIPENKIVNEIPKSKQIARRLRRSHKMSVREM